MEILANSMVNDNNSLIKHSGQVFTPAFLVNNILDYAAYVSGRILRRHVIDNSCGDGAFLCEIVARYGHNYIAAHGNAAGLAQELAEYVHGIELDATAYANCLYNLDAAVRGLGVEDVKWDVMHANALSVNRFNGKMDFVVGNPPYVRVHHLGEDYDSVKTFRFAQDGMTDLYLVFFELGFRMLNRTGRLCYITPSSWLSSLAATRMRSYIMEHRSLVGLVDLGHYQAFEQATTNTMIALFDVQHRGNQVDFYTYSPQKTDKTYVDSFSYEEMEIGGNFYVGSRHDLSLLRAIKTSYVPRRVSVKNGFATLADKTFIGDVPFQTLTIPILKASTGKWYRGFFPYDRNGKPLSREEVFSHPEIAEYLNHYKADLLKKRTEEACPGWYLYGRTQALKDVFANKYSINAIVRDVASIRLIDVPEGSGLYSGLYILTDVPRQQLEEVVRNDDFIGHLKVLKTTKAADATPIPRKTWNNTSIISCLNMKAQGAHCRTQLR